MIYNPPTNTQGLASMTCFLSSTLKAIVKRAQDAAHPKDLHSHGPYFIVCFTILCWFIQVHIRVCSISSCSYFAFSVYKTKIFFVNSSNFISMALAVSISIFFCKNSYKCQKVRCIILHSDHSL